MSSQDVNLMQGLYGGGDEFAGAAVEREAAPELTRLGRGSYRSERNLYGYDRSAYLVSKYQPRLTSDPSGVMGDDEARKRLGIIHMLYGMQNEPPEILGHFDQVIQLTYLLNGASVIQDAQRVQFKMDDNVFYWDTLVNYLGPDLRRYFRAFADDILALSKRIFKEPESFSGDTGWEYKRKLIKIAYDRGVSRLGYLAFDVVEYAELDSHEAMLVRTSKIAVVGNTPNAVDNVPMPKAVRSLDNYNSATGQSISADHDIYSR